MVPGGYLMVPGGYLNKGKVILGIELPGQLKTNLVTYEAMKYFLGALKMLYHEVFKESEFK